MSDDYQLYGGEISYFTGKVRAYLRFKDIPFVEHAATRDVYRSVILPRVGWPVIPVVVTPEDETLQDTTEIIDALEARFDEPSIYPEGPRQRLVALLLEVWADEWLKLPAMHYRWNHNTDWIIGEFGRLSKPDGTPEEQREIGEKTCRPFRGSLPTLGVTEATEGAIEHSYEALLKELDAHFATHRYLLGNRPSIGDFGLIGPLYAHQYRDPASGALMARIAPNVVAWVERVHEGEDRRSERRGGEAERERRADERRSEERPGVDRRLDERRSRQRRRSEADFLPDDAIPETLLPVLRRVAREYFGVLAAQQDALDAWAATSEDDAVPRALGMHPFSLDAGDGVTAEGERALMTFDSWMLQRPRDHLAALTGDETAACDAFLDELLSETGAPDVLRRPLRTRLTRRNFQLQRARA